MPTIGFSENKPTGLNINGFIEQSPIAILRLTTSGEIVEANNAFLRMMQNQVPIDRSVRLIEYIDQDDRQRFLDTLAGLTVDGGELPPTSMTLRLANGTVLIVSAYLSIMQPEGKDPVIILHMIDQTEQKNLEMRFAHSQKMQAVGQLAGGVAHDFNNLLTAMIGFCDLLLMRHPAGEPSFADIMQIKQNANRAANLVRQLLAFSRQQTLRPKVQDITDILTEVSHLLRRLIGANIELDVVHGGDLGLVKVDVGQMEQVLINLAVNARDAMDGGGHLTIRTSAFANDAPIKCTGEHMPPGKWVRIDVADTGCGIRPEHMDRIIEPFFTTKDVGQGTGLGLATVYGIIRQTGGYLGIESVVGEGTIFSIFLPESSETEIEEGTVAPVEDDNTSDLTGMARILLVEDEDAVRTFSARALGNKGYDVITAESGESALSVMAAQDDQNIDLMITDVIMPNMDGPTLAKHMRDANPTLKIIFISGYTEEKLKDHMGENIWFLPKPFTLKQLAAKVKEALEG